MVMIAPPSIGNAHKPCSFLCRRTCPVQTTNSKDSQDPAQNRTLEKTLLLIVSKTGPCLPPCFTRKKRARPMISYTGCATDHQRTFLFRFQNTHMPLSQYSASRYGAARICLAGLVRVLPCTCRSLLLALSLSLTLTRPPLTLCLRKGRGEGRAKERRKKAKSRETPSAQQTSYGNADFVYWVHRMLDSPGLNS